jgi:hypothetical protein
MPRDNWCGGCLYLTPCCVQLNLLDTSGLWFLPQVVVFKDSFTQLYQNLITHLNSIFTLIWGGLSTLTTKTYYKYKFY